MLAVVLAGSAILLGRSLLRRERFRERQLARGNWQLVEALAQDLRDPSGTRAKQAAEDLVHLARGEAGLKLERVRLREVLQDSLRRVSPALEQAGYELRVHEGGDPYVAAEAASLGHALDNLLRAEGERRAIQIQLRSERTTAEVAVSGGCRDERALAVAKRIALNHQGEFRDADGAITIRLPLVN